MAVQAHPHKRRKLSPSVSSASDVEKDIAVHKVGDYSEDDEEDFVESSDAESQGSASPNNSPPNSASQSDASDSEPDSDGDSDSASALDRSAAERAAMRQITFGALADAQASLSGPNDRVKARRRREGESAHSNSDSAKLSALKERLAELRARKGLADQDDDGDLDDKSRGHRRDKSSHTISKRSSHHAPTEQSSSKPVRRFRPIIPASHVASSATLEDAAAGHALAHPAPHGRTSHTLSGNKLDRDPRFSAVTTGNVPLESSRVRRNYAFLDDYRAAELASLRGAQAKLPRGAAGAEQRERLRVEIERRANRERARQERAARDDIVRQHRKAEREQIKAGKGAFWLKEREVRDRAKEIADAVPLGDGPARKRSAKEVERRKEEKRTRRDAKKMAKMRATVDRPIRGKRRSDGAQPRMDSAMGSGSGAVRRRAA